MTRGESRSTSGNVVSWVAILEARRREPSKKRMGMHLLGLEHCSKVDGRHISPRRTVALSPRLGSRCLHPAGHNFVCCTSCQSQNLDDLPHSDRSTTDQANKVSALTQLIRLAGGPPPVMGDIQCDDDVPYVFTLSHPQPTRRSHFDLAPMAKLTAFETTASSLPSHSAPCKIS